MSEVLTFLFGKEKTLFYLLVAVSSLDYITGLCAAIHMHKVSSQIGHKGITRKIVIFILVATSSMIDRYLLESTGVLYSVCIVFYITNECISVIENSVKMGIPIPEQLKKALNSLKKTNK